mmetsp:Transcript_5643/g.16215  ORF Transcript_5643/g.16215 Transcript_5643/m.16215 type:complete len:252 (-) Transcript_5643:841-1596(-)
MIGVRDALLGQVVESARGAKGGAAQQKQQEEQPQQILVPFLLLLGFFFVERLDVVVVRRLVVRRNPVQKVVVRPRHMEWRSDLVFVELVASVDLPVSYAEHALVLGDMWNVAVGVIEKLPAPGDGDPSGLAIGTIFGVGGGVVNLCRAWRVCDVRILRSGSSVPDVGRNAKAHAGDLWIQIPIEGVVGLALVGAGVPSVTLDDESVVVGFRVVTNSPKIGKAGEPIRRGRDLGHGRQPGMGVGHIDWGKFL